MPEHPSNTEAHVVGRYLAEHTPQLQDPRTREMMPQSALLAMGFMFGLLFQNALPATAERVLASMPEALRAREDAIDGLAHALNAAAVERAAGRP